MECIMKKIVIVCLLAAFSIGGAEAAVGTDCSSDPALCIVGNHEECVTGTPDSCGCANGYVDDGAGVCGPVECGAPTPPTNGAVNTDAGTQYNNVATFSCDTGYSPDDAVSTTCQAAKTWNPPTHTCIIKDCTTPTNPSNGITALDTAGETTYQATATITCNTGFSTGGTSTTITCESPGAWTALPPCVADCTTPTNPSHGITALDTAGETTYQATATITCNTGFSTGGTSTTITCESPGAWTALPPCVADCTTPTNPSHGITALDTAGETTYQATATITCNTGFSTGGTSTTITCESPGAWTALPPCVADCTTPTNPSHGITALDTAGETTYQATATITCNTGFSTGGTSTTITCESPGAWTALPPCVAVTVTGFTQTVVSPAKVTTPLATGTTTAATITVADDFGAGTITTFSAKDAGAKTIAGTWTSNDTAVHIVNTGAVTVPGLDSSAAPRLTATLTFSLTGGGPAGTIDITMLVTPPGSGTVTGFTQSVVSPVKVTTPLETGTTTAATITVADDFGDGTITTFSAKDAGAKTIAGTWTSNDTAVHIVNTGAVTVPGLDSSAAPSLTATLKFSATVGGSAGKIDLTILVTPPGSGTVTGFTQTVVSPVKVTTPLATGTTTAATITVADDFGDGTITTFSAKDAGAKTIAGTWTSNDTAVHIVNTGAVTVPGLDSSAAPSLTATLTFSATVGGSAGKIDLTILVTPPGSGAASIVSGVVLICVCGLVSLMFRL